MPLAMLPCFDRFQILELAPGPALVPALLMLAKKHKRSWSGRVQNKSCVSFAFRRWNAVEIHTAECKNTIAWHGDNLIVKIFGPSTMRFLAELALVRRRFSVPL